jgi:crotonobetainyl-CoA:carnitine CoA-transferase CaiB-like acyl-CoA transferase
MQALDPPFGMTGSAASGVPLSAQPRGRPEARHHYPIVPCKDGYTRICVLARRQWHGMFAWMGKPAEFADPRYDDLRERFNSPALLRAISAFFADKTRAELEVQGQEHGVPTAAVLTLEEALATDQLMARGFLRDAELGPGLVAPVPAGVVEIDGHRASALLAPLLSATASQRARGAPSLGRRERLLEGRPLEGIRVLDFGVIVVGGDTGRLFGDLGADVIKIENSAFPDGARGAMTASMLPGFAAGHRNKRSIGINLRDPEGRELVRRLVAVSDIVLTNFKPGVIESLGLDYAALREVNPGIVVIDSSAFGATGPWAARLGYGPLVRAAAGFTDRWVYPGEPGSFSDAITVYPDHVCARIGALAALALLIRRERTGAGGSASVAQWEVMLTHMAPLIAAMELARRHHAVADQPCHDWPWGVFPAAGDDEWIALTARDEDDWAAVCAVIGRADLHADPSLGTPRGRAASRTRIDAAVRDWSGQHSPAEAMELLQAAGVPSGAMLRAIDLPEWGYHKERRAFREEMHPLATEPWVMENVQIHSDHIADPPLGQAPLLGEQTFEIAAELLDLSADQVRDLIARGVLETA